jgi:hypothetical protein
MAKILLVLLVLTISTTAALALEAPTVNIPVAGAALGPNYDVMGSMPYRAFLVVMTDAVNAGTGEVLRSVPGIRHWTADDGTFHFRVASPRVSIGEKDTNLIYRVRVFEATPAGATGPETIIECRMAQ